MTVDTIEATKPGIVVTVEPEGIATITIDQPDEKVNVMNLRFIEELEQAIDSLPRDLRGVVIASGKENNFVAGADLHRVLEARNAEEAAELIRRLHRVLERLSRLPYASVAAINGPALGGGFELALACDYRVCVESESNILGLPEVQLGLLPAGGGTQRLPLKAGLSLAISLILEGKRFTPRRGKRYGVIDEVVHPAGLMPAARMLLTRGKAPRDQAHVSRRFGRLDRLATRLPLLRRVIYYQAAKNVRRKTHGHYPAPPLALDAIRAGQEQGFGAGLAAEAVAFGSLVMSPEARNLISLFFATEALKREQRAGSRKTETGAVGVVGAGFMGAGIAQAAAVAGADVRIRDLTPEQVARGLKTARDLTVSAGRKGRFSRQETQAIVSRLSGTTDYSGFRQARLVIEAVYEDITTKRAIIAELEEVLTPTAVIASNTSSLPIGSLAAEARHPERLVGMHFFSPVHRMPLLEVVRAEKSSHEAVAAAVAMGGRMGKTVIVVNDGPGFYTTRVLGFMAQEAGRLFEEGAAIEDIDSAMVSFGFPVGPLALSDEVGLDVAAHVGDVLGAAFPDRFIAAGAIKRLVATGRLGRKSGRGFYDYSGRKKKVDVQVYALRSAKPQSFPRDLIQRRLTLALINEAARCLEEGIVANPRDGDVGAVMGIGFPPFRGGPFRYADTLGLTAVVAELEKMAYAYGPTFAPAPILQRLATEGKSFTA